MVTDLSIGMCGGEDENGEHEVEGNRTKDGDDGAKMKCTDLDLCNIRPEGILAGTFFAVLRHKQRQQQVEGWIARHEVRRRGG